MADEEVDQMDESSSAASFAEEGAEFTAQTIDITSWFNADLSSSGSFDMGIMAAASFGKLLDVLAVPTLLIDWTYTVVFANQACGRLAANFKCVEGVPFSSLVPRSANAEKAQSLLRKVFRTRRPQVADGILELDARKIWGRLYFRSVRVGPERFVLLVIEDVTNEKTKLLLNQRKLSQAEKLAAQTDERLHREIHEHGKTKDALRNEKRRWEALSDLIPGGCAIIKNDGRVKHANAKCREYFELDGEARLGGRFQEVLDWLCSLENSQETTLEPTLFHIHTSAGTDKKITCSASRTKQGEFILFAEKYIEDSPGI